jgi:hypothetical protein
MDVPSVWDNYEEHDIIVATDGSVVFGVGYHSWTVATNNEHVLLSGGGPYDGDQILMMSYRSELGGIASGRSHEVMESRDFSHVYLRKPRDYYYYFSHVLDKFKHKKY